MSKRDALSNHEIITLAAFFLGADEKAIDSEDIAIKAFELASDRFSWKKYPENIDIFAVRSALSDARKKKNGCLLLGKDESGWRLSADGLKRARELVGAFSSHIAGPPRISKEKKRQVSIERARLLSDPAFTKLTSGDHEGLTKTEAERIFRLNEYIDGPRRIEKIERLRLMFVDDKNLSPHIEYAARMLKTGEAS